MCFSPPFPVPHRATVLKPSSNEHLAASKGHVAGGCSLSWRNCRHAGKHPEGQQAPGWVGQARRESKITGVGGGEGRGSREEMDWRARGSWRALDRQQSCHCTWDIFNMAGDGRRSGGEGTSQHHMGPYCVLSTYSCDPEAQCEVIKTSINLTLLPPSFEKLGRSFNLSEWLFQLQNWNNNICIIYWAHQY